MSSLAIELLNYLKDAEKDLTIKQINSSEAFIDINLREIGCALLELQQAGLVERINVNNEYVYNFKNEVKLEHQELSIDEYKVYFDKQKIADNFVTMATKNFINRRNLIEDDFKRNVYRHKYLMDDKHVDSFNHPLFAECKQNFVDDLNNMAIALENLVIEALKEYASFDENASGLMRVNYLKEVRQCFAIIYNSSIKYDNLNLNITYTANENTYLIEEEFKHVYMHAKKLLAMQKALYEKYQYKIKSEQAKVYGVSVKVLDKHIAYLEAKKIYDKASDAPSFNKAKTKFMALADYLDAEELAKKAGQKYEAILKEEKLHIILKDLYDKQDYVSSKLEVVDDRIKLNTNKYAELLDTIDNLEKSLSDDEMKISQQVDLEIEQINNQLKDSMERYNELFDRRIDLVDELESLNFIQYKRKKDLEARLEKISIDIDSLKLKSHNLENEREKLLKAKVGRIAKPKEKLEALKADAQALKCELSKLQNEKSILTNEYLTIQNTLNIKKVEYR